MTDEVGSSETVTYWLGRSQHVLQEMLKLGSRGVIRVLRCLEEMGSGEEREE